MDAVKSHDAKPLLATRTTNFVPRSNFQTFNPVADLLTTQHNRQYGCPQVCRGASEEEAVGHDALLDARSRKYSKLANLDTPLIIFPVLGGMKPFTWGS